MLLLQYLRQHRKEAAQVNLENQVVQVVLVVPGVLVGLEDRVDQAAQEVLEGLNLVQPQSQRKILQVRNSQPIFLLHSLIIAPPDAISFTLLKVNQVDLEDLEDPADPADPEDLVAQVALEVPEDQVVLEVQVGPVDPEDQRQPQDQGKQQSLQVSLEALGDLEVQEGLAAQEAQVVPVDQADQQPRNQVRLELTMEALKKIIQGLGQIVSVNNTFSIDMHLSCQLMLVPNYDML